MPTTETRDDQIRTLTRQMTATVHDLRDAAHAPAYVTTITNLLSDVTTNLARLANIVEDGALWLASHRHLADDARGDDALEQDCDDLVMLAGELQNLAQRTARVAGPLWSAVGHNGSAVTW